jgi:AcrR family transcriptional regulator
MTSVRERVRQEVTREILAAARRQLATVGPVALSLRAVAREVGMASSAVYRYFPSRDELLTALIVEAYDELGAAVERAEAAVPRDEHARRWQAVCRAAREWGLAHPHEFALVYGTPVPGYVAPERTVAAATRVPQLLIILIRDALATDPPVPVPVEPPAAYGELLAAMGSQVPAGRAVLGMMAWTWLIGRIGFELHGHLVGVVDPAAADAAFSWETTQTLTRLVTPAGG